MFTLIPFNESFVNVETSSPSAGICAERNALYNAITNGVRKEDISEIHVMSKNGVYPCFICRQVISEMFDEDAKVVCMNEKDEDEYKVRDLCVYPFLDEDLK